MRPASDRGVHKKEALHSALRSAAQTASELDEENSRQFKGVSNPVLSATLNLDLGALGQGLSLTCFI